MDYENFVFCSCTNIRMLRLLHDLTQAEVAGMIGMGRSSYSAVETGKQIMSFYTACRISEIYDFCPLLEWQHGLGQWLQGAGLGAHGHGLGHRRHRAPLTRSEERRVGKECRSRWSPYH